MNEQISRLTWLAGNPGDGWYEMTGRWVELLNRNFGSLTLCVEAGGGEQNLLSIADGHGHLGLSIDVVVAAAFNGAPPFSCPLRDLRCLGTGWSALPYHLLAARDTPFDLRDAFGSRRIRIGAPPKDTTDELMFQRVLAFYGLTDEGINRAGGRVMLDSYDNLIGALHNDEIDAVFGATTMPAPSIARAGRGPRAIKLSSLPADLVEHLARHYGCVPGAIPASTYPDLQDSDVETCFADTVIVVSANLDEELAYLTTRRILEEIDSLPDIHPSLADFNPFTAWRSVPAPLHPGAARAYRDFGYLN
jgi:uncharacterized protein